MGAAFSSPTKDPSSPPQEASNDLIITGLGTEWPSKLIGPDELRNYALKCYSKDAPWLKALLKINEQTGIESRAIVDLWNDPRWHRDDPPTAEEVDAAFRHYGTQLAERAALKALNDSNISPASITHMVAVTATNAGSPGYDQLVARKLGIPATAERVLLSGVGCAGGLAALRVASNLATAAAFRGQEARVLIVACELCSIQIRAELHAASISQNVGIGPALFSDGASALVLCSSKGLNETIPRRFSVVDWRTGITPGTHDEMSYKVTTYGFLLSLSKQVPKLAAVAVQQPFQSLKTAHGMASASPADFDWALHPGGLSIIKGVQMSMGLPDYALRATNEIYRTRGNTSSVAVLAVLDKLRSMEEGRQDVIACSFGPGLTIEMALLKRLL